MIIDMFKDVDFGMSYNINDYQDIEAAFSTYYTTTLLSNTITPNAIYDLEAEVDGYYVLDPMDVETVNDILYNATLDDKGKILQVASVDTDITTLKKAELEIVKQRNEIELKNKDVTKSIE